VKSKEALRINAVASRGRGGDAEKEWTRSSRQLARHLASGRCAGKAFH